MERGDGVAVSEQRQQAKQDTAEQRGRRSYIIRDGTDTQQMSSEDGQPVSRSPGLGTDTLQRGECLVQQASAPRNSPHGSRPSALGARHWASLVVSGAWTSCDLQRRLSVGLFTPRPPIPEVIMG